MNSTAPQKNSAVLLYEPRIEGHHLGWLRFITEDLLSVGYKVSLALDTREASMRRIRGHMGDLLNGVKVISAIEKDSDKMDVQAVARCFRESNCDEVFLNSFDEIASSLFRNAAVGWMPPRSLRGKLGGVFFRPRFLLEEGFSLNSAMKNLGFANLIRQGWLNQLLFLDPLARENGLSRFPAAPFFLLPDPHPENFIVDRTEAHRHFNLPDDRRIFLFYGGAYRRKGQHLAVQAFRQLSAEAPAFLLCAGQQPDDPEIKAALSELVQRKQAAVIDRYVSEHEEKQLFAASDVVLLPYIGHCGSSGVLSRAAGAGKVVIASDEQLIGRIVRENGLGILFPSGDINFLQAAIQRALTSSEAQLSKWQTASRKFGQLCSRSAFRDALLCSFAKH
jgi:glycosyltransferase involved in cell wall biosynthesis